MNINSKVQINHKDAVAIVTINNAASYNALSGQVINELIAALQSLATNSTTRAIVLTGAGDKAFSVGLDLKELNGAEGVNMGDEGERSMGVEAPLTKAFESLPQPIIAAVNGFAITGGFELALNCDFLVCSDNAQFADTHALVGLLPGWGLSQKLPRAIGLSRAKELSFTGRYIDAQEAYRLGIVNHVFSGEALLDEAVAIAERIAITDQVALEKIKHLMTAGSQMNLADGLKMEGDMAQGYNDALDFSYLEERLAMLRTLAKQ